ncbi:unnamed protein product [Caenorhabditis auriculariae]|uniref:Uncharacterized protein n=1 Tax=Caenorhabditis auriculariae TaxID=2777116 RepID=A0A8S1HWT8_9PELO|nr:unnamed protein product [Caenorhabditis auriculariae]
MAWQPGRPVGSHPPPLVCSNHRKKGPDTTSTFFRSRPRINPTPVSPGQAGRRTVPTWRSSDRRKRSINVYYKHKRGEMLYAPSTLDQRHYREPTNNSSIIP